MHVFLQKDDAQHALINNNMNMQSAIGKPNPIKPSSLNRQLGKNIKLNVFNHLFSNVPFIRLLNVKLFLGSLVHLEWITNQVILEELICDQYNFINADISLLHTINNRTVAQNERFYP